MKKLKYVKPEIKVFEVELEESIAVGSHPSSGKGDGWGHHKDSPDFPGNKNGHGDW